MTREISAESYISGTKIIPLARALERLTCSVKKPEVQKLIDNLLQRMNRKFLNTEDNILLAVLTLLDPRLLR